MSIYSEDTNLLRTHYYISHKQISKYAVPLVVYGKRVYIHKDVRGFQATGKFTHLNFVSLLRTLAFSYMRFECSNLDAMLKNVKAELFLNQDRVEVSTDQEGYFVIRSDGTIVPNARVIVENECLFPTLDEIKGRNIWPFGDPHFVRLNDDDDRGVNLFNYDTDSISLCHFANYINHIFHSEMAASILQNAMFVVYEEMNVKYCAYKMLNNVQLLAHMLFPTMYDYLTAEFIIEYMKTCQ